MQTAIHSEPGPKTGYRVLAHSQWRRHKGGYARRLNLHTRLVLSHLQSCPVMSNTSCTTLLAGSSVAGSSIPLPP